MAQRTTPAAGCSGPRRHHATLYDVLGVDRYASSREIRGAHKRLALLHHPDKGGSDADFRNITDAYDTLRDAGRRRDYDDATFGSAGGGGGRLSSAGHRPATWPAHRGRCAEVSD